jgi:peptide/nickel transport system permease protein
MTNSNGASVKFNFTNEFSNVSNERKSRSALQIIFHNRSSVFGFLVVLTWIIITVFAKFIAPYGYTEIDITNRLSAPSAMHLFGQDELGRDVLSRIIWGGQISLGTGFSVILVAALFGTAWGAVAAYSGGISDEIMMRFCDVILGFPSLVLAMAIAAALGPSLLHSMIAMAIVWWPQYARLARGMVLSEKEREYVTAARALGISKIRILVRHIIPNILGTLVVMATMDVSNAIILTAALSFLGLGAVPPTPEWGAMIAASRELIDQWWVPLFPGLALFSVAIGFNFLGDGLRDVLDPRGYSE